MAYTTNPQIPFVRRDAVALVRSGWSTRKVARHFGFSQGAVVKWCQKAGSLPADTIIPTKNARPHHHPRALPREVVVAIVRTRQGRRRCGQVVHQQLKRNGIVVSLSSVQRTLDRCGLMRKRSPWKRPHDFTLRPHVEHTGSLGQMDTIHIMAPDGTRIYVYTLIDLYSRWAYAEVVERIGAEASVQFVQRAITHAPFRFTMIQTDHGPEFSTWCTHGLHRLGIMHRHGRVRQSNDQAHIERFNRTIQEECLDGVRRTVEAFQQAIPEYLFYYNTQRLHMGIHYQTPLEVIK